MLLLLLLLLLMPLPPRVWHTGLLVKLRQYGVNGQLLEWVRDYLAHRQHSVIVGSAKSFSRPVNAGVPQGSVLGSLFFLVYVNDISHNLLSISRLFAAAATVAATATAATTGTTDITTILLLLLRLYC